jgi:cytochrome c oxidase cbb3-type subunit 3
MKQIKKTPLNPESGTNKTYKTGKITVAFLLLTYLSNLPAYSQSKPMWKTPTSDDLMLWFVAGLTLAVSVLVLLTCIYVLYAVQYMILEKQGKAKAESVWGSMWRSLDRAWTNAIPLEKEKDALLDHNYDGIRELDNHMPPWWVYSFYLTIIFAVFYMLFYHVWGTFPLQAEEYQEEEKQAQIEIAAYKKTMANSIDETNVKQVKDKATLANAKVLYDQNCKGCHGAVGEGGTGPNLTDEYWLHGGDVKDIFKTIKYGVQAKGMIPWEKRFSPADMQNLASYILSMQGTNPPNAKAPQGEKVKKK